MIQDINVSASIVCILNGCSRAIGREFAGFKLLRKLRSGEDACVQTSTASFASHQDTAQTKRGLSSGLTSESNADLLSDRPLSH